MRKILFILSLFSFLQIAAQQDFQIFKIRKYKVATLSDELRETSGLQLLNGRLYTFNDGGNTSEIFEINPKNGEVLHRIKTGLENFDWEAMTSDDENFYIGDFGNNWGTRKDLKVYRIPLQHNSEIMEKDPDSIGFYYPDQTEFIKKPQANNWDAESMIYKHGNLHIFTKEWQSYHTSHYRIFPDRSDSAQPAEKLETFNLGFMATDADYYQDELYVIGYTHKMEIYLSIFEEDENGLFFSKQPEKYYLGQSTALGQIEGIAVNSDGIFISGEEFNLKIFHAKPALYFIPAGKIR